MNNKRGKETDKMIKKLIPLFVAIVLIFIIGGIGIGGVVLKKYSYSDVMMNLDKYYSLTESDQVAIVLHNEHIETKAKMNQGIYYLDFDSVQELLNDRFYHDPQEQLLLYTTPTDIIRTSIGSNSYKAGTEEKTTEYMISFYEEDILYVALDFVKNYTNFTYEGFTSPHRIQMNTKWKEVTKAALKKNSQVRYRGGVKSEILKKVGKGEEVTVLETLENWTKVKTSDALIGYLPNKVLGQSYTAMEENNNPYVEPEYTSLVRDYKINLGWHQVMSEAANGTLSDVVADNSGLNVISPTWFSVTDNKGGMRSIASSSYVEKAHDMGLEVWGLIDNFDPDISSYTLLTTTTSRTILIDNLMAEALRVGLDGINVDFEDLSYDAGEPFVQFLRELSIRCRKEGLVLSVDNYVPRESTAHYNRKEQGIVADYVIIMGYDEHWGGGGVAGSVASLGFVEDGIKRTVNEVPGEKVINALPFYTRVWKTKDGEVKSEALDMETAHNFINNNEVNMAWNPVAGQNYGEVLKGDTLYQIWMEDRDSIAAKLDVMLKYDIGGVAAWKLGFETPDIWEEINRYMEAP